MERKSVQNRCSQPIEDNFSVRLKTSFGAFIFGFNVGKPDEYWRIGDRKTKYENEEEAFRALHTRHHRTGVS
jgi:hypothetical protein